MTSLTATERDPNAIARVAAMGVFTTVAKLIQEIVPNIPDIIKYGPWLHAKLFVLLFLIAYSFSLNFYREQLENDTCKKTGNFFRAYNEVPTVLSLLIVAYAITKTFSLLFTGITLAIGAFIIYKVLNQKPKG